MLSARGVSILVLLVTVTDFSRGRLHSHKRTRSDKNDFDVFIFTQHWPETVCFAWKEHVPSHKCLLPRHEEWTIHGIWPNRFHEIGPLFCNKTQRFDPNALSPIMNQLDEKWINIESNTPHASFWKHEWEKHGTCASVLPELNMELKYFQKGLDWLAEYEMSNVFAKVNIVPGQRYAVEEIIAGVKKILGKNPMITCMVNEKTHESYLQEVRICLDKKLTLVDCDEIPGYPTNCDRKRPVFYPSSTPTAYNVLQF